MQLAYVLALMSIVMGFTFIQNRDVVAIGLLACALAFVQGIVDFYGLSALIVFAGCVWGYYQSAHKFCLAGVVLLASGMILHTIPGFHNQCFWKGLLISPSSTPYEMYFNFDKVAVAWILWLISGVRKEEVGSSVSITHMRQTFVVLMLCVVVIIGPALASGYVRWDPKFPSEVWLWAINNLFFVCFAEEVIFRGCLQQALTDKFGKSHLGKWSSIIFSSIILGLFHFKSGGPVYVILASICGLFYGYAYHATQNIRCSMFVHFGLNLCHFLLFTYPLAAKV